MKETPALRVRIEQVVAALIDLLDALDGDPDMEPSLAAPIFSGQLLWAAGADDDCEDDDEREREDYPA